MEQWGLLNIFLGYVYMRYLLGLEGWLYLRFSNNIATLIIDAEIDRSKVLLYSIY